MAERVQPPGQRQARTLPSRIPGAAIAVDSLLP